ncbi:MAG: glycosyltransferase family 39 protein [Phormidesmis sp.]
MTIKMLRPVKSQLSTATLYRWLPIALILATAIFLFTYQLGRESLWLDEFNSLEDIDQSVLAAYKENQLRPLYYLLLMAWASLGSSDAWLRSLSVIFAVISVFLLYRLGRRLAGEAEGLIAALLLTVSPLFISHAQEIRMYALSLCLGLAGTLFVVDALLTERPHRPAQKTLAGWALFRLLAIYTVPLNITLLLPDALIVIWRFRRERRVLFNFAQWLLLLFVLWSPSVLSVVQQSSPDSSYANDHVGAVPPGPDELIRQLKFLTVWPFPVQSNAIAALFYKLFTPLVAAIIGAGIIRKHRSPKLLWTCAWLFLPIMPIVAFSYLSIPIWKSRYILFVTPFLFILLAAGFTRLWQQWKIAAVTLGALYFIAISGGLIHYYTAQTRTDYKFNVETIEQYEQPGDAIVWSYECCSIALMHYYDGSSDIHIHTAKNVKTPATAQQWVAEFPTGYDRWWLVTENMGPVINDVKSAVSNAYDIETVFEYEQGSNVMLLTPRSQSAEAASSDS